MHWMRRLIWRLEVLFLKRRAEEEMNEELQYHLDREIQANQAKGIPPGEARRKALLEFGGVERTKEQVRDARGGRRLDDLLQDVRFAGRSFFRRPGFAVTAVALMALGIGATATIFSVVDGVLLKALPYPDSENLIYVDGASSHTHPDFLAWQEGLDALRNLAARAGAEGSLTGGEAPVRVQISLVTPGFFTLLGAKPILGRLFLDEDQREGMDVVVLDHGFWVRTFGSDPGIVGQGLHLDGESVVVAGVLGPGFTSPEAVTGPDVDVWAVLDHTGALNQTRDSKTLRVLGRLKPGATLAVAQAEMDALTASLAQEFPSYFVLEDGSPRTFTLMPLQEATVREVSSTLLMLLGAVGLLLLIACSNAANLFLARGTSRAGELSLRGALGASWGRITRQLLAESAVLAAAGGLLGIGIAFLSVEVFTHFGPGDLPRLGEVSINHRVLGFSILVSMVTGTVCGVFPVFQAVGRDVSGKLREAHGRSTSGLRNTHVRSSLVVVELAMTVVLLTGAGLLFRSLLERMEVDPGFQSAQRVVMPLDLGDSYSREARAQFVLDLRERLRTVPGVRNVAAGWVTPFSLPPDHCCWATRVWPADEEDPGTGEATFLHPVTAGYFETLGVPISYGREFQESDRGEDAMVAVLNPSLARRLFGTEDVVGRQVMAGGNGPLTVVGVEAGHHHWAALDQEIDEALYLPYQTWGSWFGPLQVVLEIDVPLRTLGPTLRGAVSELDPEMALGELSTMDELISRSLANPRFLSLLFGVFALAALLLAAGGVYASMLYSVGQRRREMGIRLAMGARREQVTGLVLKDGAVLAGLGLGMGLVVALVASRLLSGLVWGVALTDLKTYGVTCLLLAVAVLTASWIPARRASRTDLVETLKTD